MRSLRGRLVAILLAVALGGMVALALITYAEQRSFLYERIDRQLQSSFPPVTGQLAFAAATSSSSCNVGDPRSRNSDEASVPPAAVGGEAPGKDGPPFTLPPGTYAAALSASGTVTASCLFGYGGSTTHTTPQLEGRSFTNQPQTISSNGSDFRAAARSTPTGGQIVVAIPLSDTRQTINRLVLVEAIVIAIALAVLGIAAWLLVGIGLRPLDRMGRTADAIAGGDLTRRVEPANGQTEIGRLGLALNHMLQRLEGAFKQREASEESLRRFLADASHELRTPLVSIRGYAELHRIGATTSDEEVARSMERIEQEAQRMGVLVEDMLSLARLDETHENRYVPVDISAIAANAVRDAEASAPDRSISLSTEGSPIVSGDADQLHQVFSNLLVNAVVHTPAGTPVEVSITHSGDDLRIDIRDHGAGLPDGAGDQIFERFWRAESGRARGRAGSGLGLAIVREIVAAHGGRVHAKNAEDGPGAVVSIWLPLPSGPEALSELSG